MDRNKGRYDQAERLRSNFITEYNHILETRQEATPEGSAKKKRPRIESPIDLTGEYNTPAVVDEGPITIETPYCTGKSTQEVTTLLFKLQVYKDNKHEDVAKLKEAAAGREQEAQLKEQQRRFEEFEYYQSQTTNILSENREIQDDTMTPFAGRNSDFSGSRDISYFENPPPAPSTPPCSSSRNFTSIQLENNSENWRRGEALSTAGRTPVPTNLQQTSPGLCPASACSSRSPSPRSPSVNSPPPNETNHVPSPVTAYSIDLTDQGKGRKIPSRAMKHVALEDIVETSPWTDAHKFQWHLEFHPVNLSHRRFRDDAVLSIFANIDNGGDKNLFPREGVPMSFTCMILPQTEELEGGRPYPPLRREWNRTFGKKNCDKVVEDWGYPDFCLVSELYPHYVNEDGMLSVELSYCINIRPSRHLRRHNKTGMVGLENQGTTCYMNSLLQVLYHLRTFRRCVYRAACDKSYLMQEPQSGTTQSPSITSNTPLSNKREQKRSRDITRALAATFHQMQKSEDSTSTLTLTESFGWEGAEAYVQHDLHELARMLLDRVEGRISETPYEGILDRLLQGKQQTCVRCKNVDYTSSRTEPFSDIQLDVKDCDSIEDSFKKYIKAETLDGDNQYDTDEGGYGKQDAEKGIIFESLPPILSLHLKRFEFDLRSLERKKVNDRFEFPLELDVSGYMCNLTDSGATYHLHSIIVHEGGINVGHYYTYIRPKLSSYNEEDPEKREWFKFNDDIVSLVKSEEEMLESVYGPKSDSKSQRPPTAYMLTYIRDGDLEEVLGDDPTEDHEQPAAPMVNEYGTNPPNKDDIPPEFEEYLNQSRSEQSERKEKREEESRISRNKVLVKLATDYDILTFDHLDGKASNNVEVDKIINADDNHRRNFSKEQMRNYIFDFESVVAIEANLDDKGWDIIQKVAETLKIPTYCIRLWGLVRHEFGRTLMVQNVISRGDLNDTLGRIIAKTNVGTESEGYPFFYVEVMTKERDEFILIPSTTQENKGFRAMVACPPKFNVYSTNYEDLVPEAVREAMDELDDFDKENDKLGINISHESLHGIHEAYANLGEADDANELVETLFFAKQFQYHRDDYGNRSFEVPNHPFNSDNFPLHYIGKIILRSDEGSKLSKAGATLVSLDLRDDDLIANIKRAVGVLSERASALNHLGTAGPIDVESPKFRIHRLQPPKRTHKQEMIRAIPKEFYSPSSSEIPTPPCPPGNLFVFEDNILSHESHPLSNLIKVMQDRTIVRLLPLTAMDASYLKNTPQEYRNGLFTNLKREIVAVYSRGKGGPDIAKMRMGLFSRQLVNEYFGGQAGQLGYDDDAWSRLRIVKASLDLDNQIEAPPEPDAEAKMIMDNEDKQRYLTTDVPTFFDDAGWLGDKSLRLKYCFFHISPFTSSDIIEGEVSLGEHDAKLHSTTIISASSELRKIWEAMDPLEAARSPKFWLPLVEKPVLVGDNTGVKDIAEMFCRDLSKEEEGSQRLIRRVRIFHIKEGRFVSNLGSKICDTVNFFSTTTLIPKGKIADHKMAGKEWNLEGQRGSFYRHKLLIEVVPEEEDEMWKEEFPQGERVEGKMAKVVPIQVLFLSDEGLKDEGVLALTMAVPMLTFLRRNETGSDLRERVFKRLGLDPATIEWELSIVPPNAGQHEWVDGEMSVVEGAEEFQQSNLWKYLGVTFPAMFGRSAGERYRRLTRRVQEEDGNSARLTVEDFSNCPTVGFMVGSSSIDEMRRARTHLCLGSAGLKYYPEGMCAEVEVGQEKEHHAVSRNTGGIQFKDRSRTMSE